MSGIGPMLVAVDDGYDYIKVWTRERSDRIPTAVSLTTRTTANLLDRRDTRERVYEIDGASYAVGPDVLEPMDTRYEDFPFSPANLAVAMDAIRRVVPSPVMVHVVAGVPLNRYYDRNGDVRHSMVDRKSAAWLRTVRASSGAPLPVIAQVSLIAEAVAAWFDFVIDDAMQERSDLVDDYMAVVDIGGRTTDVAVFENGDLDMRQSGTLDHGVLDVSSEVSRVLEDRYTGMRQFPWSVVEPAIRTGQALIGSATVDVSAEVASQKRVLVERVAQFMQSRFGNNAPLIKRVLFVGGGSSTLEPELRRMFPSAVFARDPQLANARGMYKYGAMMCVIGTRTHAA